LKQEKFREIERLLPRLRNKTCLDIGGDNGVISYLLRQKGGTWHSADMSETIESIRQIVGENVHAIEGARLPFPDGFFDLVVVIDFLEHVHDDDALAKELHRVLRQGGDLIVNVPHLKRCSVLRPIRLALGLTDEWHGHVRPGYRERELRQFLSQRFVVGEVKTYSRFFSHAIDTVFAFLHGRPGKGKQTSKGVVVTEDDFRRRNKALRYASAMYPLCWMLVQFNRLLFFTKGYLLILRAKKRTWVPS
jgi:SAM-dependent methyltransferase